MKGHDNVVANTLFMHFEEKGSLFALSLPVLIWIKEGCQEWLAHDIVRHLIKLIQEDLNPPPGIHGTKIY